jgi:hypothetical protein
MAIRTPKILDAPILTFAWNNGIINPAMWDKGAPLPAMHIGAEGFLVVKVK